MNDGQFEGTMTALEINGYGKQVAKLRARDTAQREALARVEGERDEVCDGLDRQTARLIAAHAQLAEAVDCLTGCAARLRVLIDHDKHKLLDVVAEEKAKAFLARHAQAEQQEAQGAQAGEFQREDRYIVIKRKDLESTPTLMTHAFLFALDGLLEHLPKRECLVVESDWPEYGPTWAAIQARVEGQGAQAGDERAAFEQFVRGRFPKTGLGIIDRPGSLAHGQYESFELHVAWVSWYARAALATQPAVRGAEHE